MTPSTAASSARHSCTARKRRQRIGGTVFGKRMTRYSPIALDNILLPRVLPTPNYVILLGKREEFIRFHFVSIALPFKLRHRHRRRRRQPNTLCRIFPFAVWQIRNRIRGKRAPNTRIISINKRALVQSHIQIWDGHETQTSAPVPRERRATSTHSVVCSRRLWPFSRDMRRFARVVLRFE